MRESLTDLIGTLKGRVAVTAFASNVARLDTVARAAQAPWPATSRWSAAPCTRSSRRRATRGYLKDFPPSSTRRKRRELPPRKVLYLCTGSQGEPRAALSRIADDRASECEPWATATR